MEEGIQRYATSCTEGEEGTTLQNNFAEVRETLKKVFGVSSGHRKLDKETW